MKSPRALPGWLRLLALLVLFPLGAVPSLLFFAWIERGSTLPVIPIELGWPLVRLFHWPLPALIAWDVSLLLLFGAIHTALAQAPAHRLLERALPPQLTRIVYLAITGLSAWGVMSLWQHTGIVLWTLHISPPVLSALSLVIYWSLMGVSATLVARHDAFYFFGLRQLYSSSSRKDGGGPATLIQTGLYGRVRHPLYTFTFLAFAVAPMMPLDRALVILGLGLYLAFGIPIEERKLIAQFGDTYRRYRKRVPAVIPGFPR